MVLLHGGGGEGLLLLVGGDGTSGCNVRVTSTPFLWGG